MMFKRTAFCSASLRFTATILGLLLSACDEPVSNRVEADTGATVDTGPTETADTDLGDSQIDSGEEVDEGSCWIDGVAAAACPARPKGLRPDECASGEIDDGSGFEPGTGLCLPVPPSSCATDDCDLRPTGSRPEDCSSGQIFEDSGFAPGTGTCLPNLEDWDCPVGWRPIDATLDDSGLPVAGAERISFRRCEPPDVPRDCPPGTIALPGDTACLPLGQPCPTAAERWPTDEALRAMAPGFDGPIVFVSPDGSGDGSRLDPMSLNRATYLFNEVPPGAIIAMALGDYPDIVELDDGVALVGACVGGTRLVPEGDYVDVGAVSMTGALGSLVANLAIDAATNGVVVRGSPEEGVVHRLHDLQVTRAFQRGIAVTDAGRLHLTNIRVSGVTLDLNPVYLESGVLSGGGLVASYGATVTGEGILIDRLEHAGLWVDAPDGRVTRVDLSRLVVDSPSLHPTFPWSIGVGLMGGTEVALRDLALFDAGFSATANDTVFGLVAAPMNLTLERCEVRGAGPSPYRLDGLSLSDVSATIDDLVVRDVEGAALSAVWGQLELNQFAAERCATDPSASTCLALDGVEASLRRAVVRQTDGTAVVVADAAELAAQVSLTQIFVAETAYGVVIDIDLEAPVTEVAVVASQWFGLQISGGVTRFENLLMAGAGQAAIYVQPSLLPIIMTAQNLTVLGGADGLHLFLPWGSEFAGPDVTLQTALLRGQQAVALYAYRSSLHLFDLVVSGSEGAALSLWSSNADGAGIAITEGGAGESPNTQSLLDLSLSSAVFERLTLLQNARPAAIFYDSEVTITGARVDHLAADAGASSAGRGVSIETGSHLRLYDAFITRNDEVALFVDAESSLELTRSRLGDNRDSLVAMGGTVQLTDVSVGRALFAATPDAEAVLGEGFGRLYFEGANLTASSLQSEAPLQLTLGARASIDGLFLRNAPSLPELPLLLLDGDAVATVDTARFDRASAAQTVGSDLTLRDVVFRSSAGAWRLQGADGLPAVGVGERLLVDGTGGWREEQTQLLADGIVVERGSSLSLEDVLVRGFDRSGLIVADPLSSLAGERLVVKDIGPVDSRANLLSADERGRAAGIRAEDASISLQGASLRGNRATALHVRGAQATLRFDHLDIDATLPVEDEQRQLRYGDGLVLGDGATLDGTQLRLRENPRCGLQLYGNGLSIQLRDALIRGNLIGINVMGSDFSRTELAVALRNERYEQNGLDLGVSELEIPDIEAALAELQTVDPSEAEPLASQREDCSNGEDDNGDGTIDCQDEQCSPRPFCITQP